MSVLASLATHLEHLPKPIDVSHFKSAVLPEFLLENDEKLKVFELAVSRF